MASPAAHNPLETEALQPDHLLRIGDRWYAIFNRTPDPRFETASFRLAKLGSSGLPESYYPYRRLDGERVCTCPGFRFRSQCKHLDALTAEGLL